MRPNGTMPASPFHRLTASSFWEAPVEGSALPDRRKHFLVLGLVWAASTLLLFLFRPGYTFPPLDLIDSWVYTGYQWDFRGHLAEFGPLYYGSRLSWILPGVFLHSLLPPVAANICFKLIVSALLATACAATVYRTLGAGGALTAVILSVFCPQIIFALQTDYVDTAVILYGALALAGITVAKDSKNWALWIFVSGAMFTGMVVANLTSLGFPGLGIAVYHLLWLRWGFRRQLLCLCLYLTAAAVVVAGLGLANRHFGGEFLFLKPQFAMLSQLKAPGGNPWAPKDWHWLWEATWVILPLSTLLWGAYRSWIARASDARAHLQGVALTAALTLSFALAALFEASGQPVLFCFYYASFHLGLALPLLVVCCASGPGHHPARVMTLSGALLALAAIVLFADEFAYVEYNALCRIPMMPSPRVVPGVAALLLFLLALLSLRPGRFLRPILRPEFFLVAILACSIAPSFHLPNIPNRLRDRYGSIHAAFQQIQRDYPADSYRLWEYPDQLGSRSLTSAWLWGYRLFAVQRFPLFDANSVGNLGDRTLIITAPASRGERVLLEAKNALARDAEVTHEKIIRVPGANRTGFDLVAVTLTTKLRGSENWGAYRDTTKALLDLNAEAPIPYFEKLEKNLYGSTTFGRSALVTADGITRFTRTDPRDHLATPYRKLSTSAKPGRQLAITVEMPSDSQTFLVVQDEAYQTLGQFPLRNAGQHDYTVDVPAGSHSIRVYLMSPTDASTALPERVTVYEVLPQIRLPRTLDQGNSD